MPSILEKLFRKKEDVEKDKYVIRLQAIMRSLQQKLLFWKDREVEDEELIKALRTRVSELSFELEDAKDMLFSEIDFREMSFDAECERFIKLQNKLRAAKNQSKQLKKLLKDYELRHREIRKQVQLMNSRAEENDRYSNSLIRRKAEADAIAQYWAVRMAQQRNAPQQSSPMAFNVL